MPRTHHAGAYLLSVYFFLVYTCSLMETMVMQHHFVDSNGPSLQSSPSWVQTPLPSSLHPRDLDSGTWVPTPLPSSSFNPVSAGRRYPPPFPCTCPSCYVTPTHPLFTTGVVGFACAPPIGVGFVPIPPASGGGGGWSHLGRGHILSAHLCVPLHNLSPSSPFSGCLCLIVPHVGRVSAESFRWWPAWTRYIPPLPPPPDQTSALA